MSELTVSDGGQMIGPEMTRKEAQECAEKIDAHANGMKWELLRQFEGKGYKVLGWSEFTEYCEERHGIQVSDRTVKNWLMSARVERNLFGTEEKVKHVSLSVRSAAELAKLSSVQQKSAYEQMEALREHGMRTEREYHIGLKKLVAQMLNREKAAKPESTPVLPASQPNQDKPDFFETPAPPKTESKPKPTVSTFTPAVDPDPAEELFSQPSEPIKCPDPEELKVAFDQAWTWAKNGEVDGSHKTRLWVLGCLNEFSCWLENSQ